MAVDVLGGLNDAQRAAAEAIDGPVLIIAGPGSGKTRVITHRIAYLTKVCGVRAHNILAVTFTNKAANEMRTRLQELVPGMVEHLTSGTFHAFCSRLLRREAKAIGLDPSFVIYDEDDQLALVKQVLKELNLDDKRYQPRAVLSHISAAKSELRGPYQYAEHAASYWEEIVLRVYRRYQDLLLDNRAQDFDDLLMNTVRLFREAPAVLEKYQERYVHILVDEFQDTNVAQYVLVKQLAAAHRNICVVGDPDQSIYSWRQADIRNILNFEGDFPDARVVYLEQNYRSTKTILEAARRVIALNALRKDKQLWTSNEQGLPVTVFEAYNEVEEASHVAAEIERLVARGECALRDCAVMYRTNAQSRVLEEAFMRKGLHYKLVGGVRFYERREVKDVLAYLRLIQNPYDSVSLHRVINVPPRGIGNKTLGALERWAHGMRLSMFDALQALRDGRYGDDSPFNTRAEQLLIDFLRLLEGLVAAFGQLGVSSLIELVLVKSGYADHLKDGSAEGEERWANVKELLTVAADFDQLRPETGLAAFLEESALIADVDSYDGAAEAVTMITLHAAKGLEFPVVFIVGVEEGICPHSRSFDDYERMEEERRLFYVGMTRAMRRLYLVYAFRRTSWGSSNVSTPSRFLADIPGELVKGRDAPPGLGEPPRTAPVVTAVAPPSPVVRSAPSFKAGDRVRHPKFGDGVVISATRAADDEEVTVLFSGSIGERRLSLSFARLERLSP